MASSHKFEIEIDMKCNVEKVWESVKNSTTAFPRASPEEYESIEVLEGDGVSVGSIFVVDHPRGHPIPWTRKMLELVDKEKKTLSCSIIGGDLMKYYPNYKGYIVVTPNGKGTLAKWYYEANKALEDAHNLDGMKDLIVKTTRDLEQ